MINFWLNEVKAAYFLGLNKCINSDRFTIMQMIGSSLENKKGAAHSRVQ